MEILRQVHAVVCHHNGESCPSSRFIAFIQVLQQKAAGHAPPLTGDPAWSDPARAIQSQHTWAAPCTHSDAQDMELDKESKHLSFIIWKFGLFYMI